MWQARPGAAGRGQAGHGKAGQAWQAWICKFTTQKEKHMDNPVNELTVTNSGPIESATIQFRSYGVTYLEAPNGAGKSIILGCAQSLARGNGKVPLRHGSERGSVSGFGARLTLTPKSTRHVGEFQASSLEGSFDIASLVDPGLKDPLLTDRKRIKALLSLTGVQGDAELFLERDEFNVEDFRNIVSRETRACKDIVEMAAKVARDYQQEARGYESLAREDERVAKSHATFGEYLNPYEEMDEEAVQQEMEDALAEKSRWSTERGLYRSAKERAEVAKDQLAEMERVSDAQLQNAVTKVNYAMDRVRNTEAGIAALEKQLDQARTQLEMDRQADQHAKESLQSVRDAIKQREAFEQAIRLPDDLPCPTDEAIQDAHERMVAARRKLELAAKRREARAKRQLSSQYAEAAKRRFAKAEELRRIAAVTDLVLQDAIPPGELFVRGGRLWIKHPRRNEDVLYHELSHAERWRVAVKLGASVVGEGGLVTIPQEAWEGMDVTVRKEVHEYAKELRVFILTAQATREEGVPEGMLVRYMNGDGESQEGEEQ